ncbi:hypothetical protein WAI453_000283 [Rhynchosporium graminicola]
MVSFWWAVVDVYTALHCTALHYNYLRVWSSLTPTILHPGVLQVARSEMVRPCYNESEFRNWCHQVIILVNVRRSPTSGASKAGNLHTPQLDFSPAGE